jgi:DNA-binding Xre family transcriptional regulator
MVYWRVAEMLKKRKWTRYRLVKESGLPTTTVYRLARPGQEVQRIDGRTLDALCRAFRCGVGEIVEYVPDRKAG